MDLEALKYPVGKWTKPTDYQAEMISNWIEEIRTFPDKLSILIQNVPEASYQFRYRPDGWTIRQVVHHVADSHMNAYIRHRLAFTENEPRITAYNEKLWAELEDVRMVPVNTSLLLLKSLHQRWTVFLSSVDETSLLKGFIHPEHNRLIPLNESIGLYAWHCRHHYAHVQNALTNPY